MNVANLFALGGTAEGSRNGVQHGQIDLSTTSAETTDGVLLYTVVYFISDSALLSP